MIDHVEAELRYRISVAAQNYANTKHTYGNDSRAAGANEGYLKALEDLLVALGYALHTEEEDYYEVVDCAA